MSKEFDLEDIIKKLKNKKEIYTSEIDFQFALAWAIKEKYKQNVEVKLEFSPPNIKIKKTKRGKKYIENSMHIDILVIYNKEWYPIELKYKTKPIIYTSFELRNQGARDQGKCNFLWDIKRLEFFKEKLKANKKNNRFKKGYAIFLTNDTGYQEVKEGSKDYEFRLENKRIIKPTEILKWADDTSDGTIGSCPYEIKFNQEYTIQWDKFYTINKDKNGIFQYLLVSIK